MVNESTAGRPATAGAPVTPAGLDPPELESLFHPAVAAWFSRRFPAGPTPPQSAAWPHIAAGSDVLVASPTGSGKTLTGFLVAIDAAYRAAEAGTRSASAPEVLYISPLRALAVDVHENLHVPLTEIRTEAARLGCPDPGLRVAIRTGDTPPGERAAMRRQSPDLLVTTPESLYLLLTAPSSRAMLRGVRTVIVDEVHTLARDKRGSHLSLSLERLDALVSESGGRLQRIGLSATQRPLDVVARLLTGVHPDRPPAVVVDCGHARDLEVSIELPSSELEAVMSGGQMSDILDRIAEHTRHHRTTLVFVNTRKMAERVAHQLAERLAADGERRGDDVDASLLVAAHHGSLSAGPPAHRRDATAAPVTCGHSSPPPRSSWVSTSDRSSWCVRSGLRGPSAPSSSASAVPTTTGTGHRPAGSIRRRGTSSWSAPHCWRPCARAGSTCSTLRSPRSTSSSSSSWPRWPPPTNARSRPCGTSSGAPRRTPT